MRAGLDLLCITIYCTADDLPCDRVPVAGN